MVNAPIKTDTIASVFIATITKKKRKVKKKKKKKIKRPLQGSSQVDLQSLKTLSVSQSERVATGVLHFQLNSGIYSTVS